MAEKETKSCSEGCEEMTDNEVKVEIRTFERCIDWRKNGRG